MIRGVTPTRDVVMTDELREAMSRVKEELKKRKRSPACINNLWVVEEFYRGKWWATGDIDHTRRVGRMVLKRNRVSYPDALFRLRKYIPAEAIRE